MTQYLLRLFKAIFNRPLLPTDQEQFATAPTSPTILPSLTYGMGDWIAAGSNRAELLAILHNPAFREACALIQNAATPTVDVSRDTTELNNNRLVWLSGYNGFVQDLIKLSHVNADQGAHNSAGLGTAPPVKEWEHIG